MIIYKCGTNKEVFFVNIPSFKMKGRTNSFSMGTLDWPIKEKIALKELLGYKQSHIYHYAGRDEIQIDED